VQIFFLLQRSGFIDSSHYSEIVAIAYWGSYILCFYVRRDKVTCFSVYKVLRLTIATTEVDKLSIGHKKRN
jgi:hypothetical protein